MLTHCDIVTGLYNKYTVHTRGGWSIEAEEVTPPLFLRGKREIKILKE